MPRSKNQRRLRTMPICAVVLLLIGLGLLWWDSQREFTIYTGSYEPIGEGSEFYIGPSMTEICASALCLLGVALLGVTVGVVKSARTSKAQLVILFSGIALLAIGIATLVWDYYQVRTFGWFAYAPLSKSDFAPARTAQFFGKLAIVGAVFLTALVSGQRFGKKTHNQVIAD